MMLRPCGQWIRTIRLTSSTATSAITGVIYAKCVIELAQLVINTTLMVASHLALMAQTSAVHIQRHLHSVSQYLYEFLH